MRVAVVQRMFRRAIAVAAVLGAVSAVAIPAAEAQWWPDRPFVQPWHRVYRHPWGHPLWGHPAWGPEFYRPWRPVLFRPRPAFAPSLPPPPPIRTVVVRPPVVYRPVIVPRPRPVIVQRTVVIHAPPVIREKVVYRTVPVYLHRPVVHHQPVHHYHAIHYDHRHCGCY